MNTVHRGYLPNDMPTPGKTLILGFQHVLTMFPATVLVALLVGFDVGVVLFMSGVATIAALLLSRLLTGIYIPLYYGSSFSYIAATLAITQAEFGVYAGDAVRLAQVGIVATGVVNIGVGLAVRFAGGKKTIDKFLPPVITGSVAIVIGAALAFAALDMASNNWSIAFVTLTATILYSVYLRDRGFIGLLPILLGAATGYFFAAILGKVDLDPIGQAAFFEFPNFTTPNFGNSRSWEAIATIAVIAVATIPESTAHLYQIGLYTDKLAESTGREKPGLSNLIGINLIVDGVGDLINGLFGGVAGTNYGENNSLMVITRNYSGPVLMVAGGMAILLGFVGKLVAAVSTIPVAVTGGLAIYLFGVIAKQGIALMIAEEVDLYKPENLAIGAVILVIGIGGHIGFPNGTLPFLKIKDVFPDGVPAIAFAAAFGILLNLVFTLFPPPKQ